MWFQQDSHLKALWCKDILNKFKGLTGKTRERLFLYLRFQWEWFTVNRTYLKCNLFISLCLQKNLWWRKDIYNATIYMAPFGWWEMAVSKWLQRLGVLDLFPKIMYSQNVDNFFWFNHFTKAFITCMSELKVIMQAEALSINQLNFHTLLV